MKNFLFLFLFILSSLRLSANADITLCVDISCFPSTTAPSVFGGFNGWCANCNPLTDQGGGIWCATVNMPDGAQEYKFFFQEEGEETLTPGDPCTVTNFGFTNRVVNVVNGVNQTLNYGWESCDLMCTGGPPPGADITFCVDVSCYPSVTAPAVGGTFNGWCAGCDLLQDPEGDGIWCGTVAMPGGPQEYKFFFQEQGFENMETPEDDACTVTNFGFTNRIIDVAPGVPQTVTFGWQACDAICKISTPGTGPVPPICPAINVVSLYSDEYLDVPVASWLGAGSMATLNDIVIDGNNVKHYTDVTTIVIEPSSPIDALGMTMLHLDFWTDMPDFKINLYDYGEDGALGGNDDPEMEYHCINNPVCEWVSFKIPVEAFINLEPNSEIHKIVISGMPAGGSIYFDNIYFCNDDCEDLNDIAPNGPAPDPVCDAANVISMFSNVYTDVPVDTWLTFWSSATLTDLQISGNDTKLYQNVDFLGIETVGPNLIDATGMDYLNLDIWTPNMTTFRVKLVDFGPNGVFDGGGDDSEHELLFAPNPMEWVQLQIPLADFVGLASREHLAQMIFSGIPAGGGTVYVDNVYYSTCAPAPPVMPLTDAPDPTCDPQDVISMFSGVYTDVPVDTWLTFWSNAIDGGIVPVNGNDTRLYQNVDFLGIETVGPNLIDASGMTYFNIDVWTPDMTTFRVKLVDFGPNEVFDGGGDDSEHELIFTPVQSGWNTYNIPMADFVGLANTDNIAQLILSGLPAGAGMMYIDNVYYSNCAPPPPTMPVTAAPDPTCDPQDVISMFSDAYVDVPVDTWLTFWSNAVDGGIVPVAGNDTRLYQAVDFLGIETVGPNLIDASGMTHFNIDVWTPDMTTFRVKLVDFGPNEVFDGGGDDSEHELVFTPTLSGWNTYSIPLTDFTGLLNTDNIAQLILSGLPTGAGMMYIDNVYYSNCASPPPTMPVTAAPDPTCDPQDVISMFSGVYTDVPVDTWLTFWSNAIDGGIVPVAGNDTRLYQAVDFLGIETVGPNLIDASGMTHFNIDVWTPDMTTFRVKLVDFGANEVFDGGGDDSEHELVFTPTLSGWNTYSIPLTDFTGLLNTDNIAQLILSGLPAGAGMMYIDNVYYSNCASPPPTMPLTAAPDPTCDPQDVISMFSNVYTDVTVDTWLTFWSNATLTDLQLFGNDTKLYQAVDFLGIETVGPNLIDASGMTYFNIDVWTPDMTTFRVKLVDFGANEVFDGGGDDSEHELIFTPAQSGWNTYNIPLTDFTGLLNTDNIAQLILSGLPTATGMMYIDNVYFSNCQTP